MRLKAALALTGGGDKEGVPTLIAFLAHDPSDGFLVELTQPRDGAG